MCASLSFYLSENLSLIITTKWGKNKGAVERISTWPAEKIHPFLGKMKFQIANHINPGQSQFRNSRL